MKECLRILDELPVCPHGRLNRLQGAPAVVGIKVIGAAATAIAAVLGVVFLLVPNLKPQPTPQKLDGEISSVIWRQPANHDLNYDVVASIDGYSGQTCRLAWSVYESQGHYIGSADTDALDLTAERNEDRGGGPVSIPEPSAPGEYYVIFTLFAPNGTQLDSKQSQIFTVTA